MSGQIWTFIRIMLGLLAFSAGGAACSTPLPADGTLPFETIEQKKDAAEIGQQHNTSVQPGILVFSDLTALSDVETWFSSAARNQLQIINYRSYFTIVVFQGWQLTGGYGVEILRIEERGEVIRVIASFERPGGEQEGTGFVTSPYHLVQVRRPQRAIETLRFELYVDGEIAAEFPTPVP